MEEKVWHKLYPPGVKPTIDYEELTISQALTRSAERFPDGTALTYMGNRISYIELDGLVNRFARALMELGIKAGDKVSLLFPNIPQAVITCMAAHRIGAVAVQNNPMYTERELQYQFSDSGSRLVVSFNAVIPRVVSFMSKTNVEKVISCSPNTFLPSQVREQMPEEDTTGGPTENVLLFEDLMEKYSADPLEDKSKWEELSTLIYTGGTTGVSKGVMLSHKNISINVQQYRACLNYLKEGEEAALGNFPLFHAAGYTGHQNICIWMGWEHIMVPRPEPDIITDLVKNFKPTIMGGVPTLFTGLLNSPEFRAIDLSFIKAFLSGAAPLPEEIVRDLTELTGAGMIEAYGLSEVSPIATLTPLGGKLKVGTAGIPLPDMDIKVVDIETGEKEMKPGEEGEIIIKGPNVMMGYYNKPEETKKALKDGWVYTGDIGVFDEEGYLTIVDRKKDMIIASGYNIYPVEIDNLLYDIPEVLEACTVGVPHEYRGETVKAFIVLKEGQTLTEEQVMNYCKERLAPYKVPKIIAFVGELPKSTVGKILRRELRDMEVSKAQKK